MVGKEKKGTSKSWGFSRWLRWGASPEGTAAESESDLASRRAARRESASAEVADEPREDSDGPAKATTDPAQSPEQSGTALSVDGDPPTVTLDAADLIMVQDLLTEQQRAGYGRPSGLGRTAPPPFEHRIAAPAQGGGVIAEARKRAALAKLRMVERLVDADGHLVESDAGEASGSTIDLSDAVLQEVGDYDVQVVGEEDVEAVDGSGAPSSEGDDEDDDEGEELQTIIQDRSVLFERMRRKGELPPRMLAALSALEATPAAVRRRGSTAVAARQREQVSTGEVPRGSRVALNEAHAAPVASRQAASFTVEVPTANPIPATNPIPKGAEGAEAVDASRPPARETRPTPSPANATAAVGASTAVSTRPRDESPEVEGRTGFATPVPALEHAPQTAPVPLPEAPVPDDLAALGADADPPQLHDASAHKDSMRPSVEGVAEPLAPKPAAKPSIMEVAWAFVRGANKSARQESKKAAVDETDASAREDGVPGSKDPGPVAAPMFTEPTAEPKFSEPKFSEPSNEQAGAAHGASHGPLVATDADCGIVVDESEPMRAESAMSASPVSFDVGFDVGLDAELEQDRAAALARVSELARIDGVFDESDEGFYGSAIGLAGVSVRSGGGRRFGIGRRRRDLLDPAEASVPGLRLSLVTFVVLVVVATVVALLPADWLPADWLPTDWLP